MPRPLTDLLKHEQDLYGDLGANPLAVDTALLLADAAEDQGQEKRTALLRQQSRTALLELLKGAALSEAECGTILAEPSLPEAERRIAQALGLPRVPASLPDVRTPEGLRQQYDYNVALLASLDLLTGHNGALGITGIDSHFHRLPSLARIEERLQAPLLRQKVAQGFHWLLLVPFGLPLPRLLDAWRRDLLRNEHLLLQPYGGLDREDPVWVWEEPYMLREGRGPDEDGRLVYFPQRFGRRHGGRTKRQLLAADPSQAWHVLLIEPLEDIPLAGQGQTIAGRRQLETDQKPRQYLRSLPAGERGWTPETYVAAFCAQLERAGRVLDAHTTSTFIAAYLPASGGVPDGWWGVGDHVGDHHVCLGCNFPDFGGPRTGARSAVPVM
jgi:hypothetical protein